MAGNGSAKFWRVLIRRAPKAHLTMYESGKGTSDVALCGKKLPADERRTSSVTITVPLGNECNDCLQLAGLPVQKSLRRLTVKSPLMEKVEMLNKFKREIDKLKISDAAKEAALQIAFRQIQISN